MPLDIPQERLPRHIAIIMDGNGRWAVRRGLERVQGHQQGAKTVRTIVTECANLRKNFGGPDYLTLYSFSLENWKFKDKDPVRREEGDLAHAVQMMNTLDKSGRAALTKLMGVEAVGDDLKMTEVGPEEASKLLAPTKQHAAEFAKHHPVLAYILRVGKEVYWHPKNPMRAVLAKSGTKGKYTIEVHRWTVTSVEGAAKTPREWPLRVVRFKSDKVDTGWKILPASDWNAE